MRGRWRTPTSDCARRTTPAEEADERARAEAALHREQDFLRAVLEHAADGIVACDGDGVLRLFNRATRSPRLPEEPLPPERWAEHYDLYLPDGTTRMATEQVPLFRALRDGRADTEMVIAPKGGTRAACRPAAGRSKTGTAEDRRGRRHARPDRAAAGRGPAGGRGPADERAAIPAAGRALAARALSCLRPDGRTRQVNRAFTKLFGITLDELKDYNILGDPQLVATGIMPLMARAFAGEAVVIEPIPYVRDRGEHVGQTRWAGAHVYPVKDDAGRVEEVVLVHTDVTEQRLAEQSLRDSEERFRAAFDRPPSGSCWPTWTAASSGRTRRSAGPSDGRAGR